MVDPNRKINRISDKEMTFLEECETEFASRYTDADTEFIEHCAKTVPEPPMIEDWLNANTGGGGGGRGGYFSPNNRFNGGQRRGGDRGWQRRGGGHHNHDRGFRDNRRHRYDPMQRRNRGDNGDSSGRQHERHHEHNNRNEPPTGSPMKVRRDYGNFVPASK